MRVTRELRLAAPLDHTWAALAAAPRSGWTTGGATDGSEGLAVLDDLDDDEHVAGFHVEARERGGHATALGTITSRLESEGDRTRVSLEADLAISGGADQPMAEAVLEDFARGLEGRLPAAEPVGRRRRLAVAGTALLLALFVVWRMTRR